MSPEKKEVLKGGGLLTYRLAVIASGIIITYMQYNSSDKQDSIKMKLDRIEYRLDQEIRQQEKIETRVQLDEAEYRQGDARLRSDLEDFKDKYIFNNPYFKPKNN